jgi:hypothetical protein
MGKPSGGGGTVSYFTSNKTGSGSVGLETWVDLGLIPTGYKIWVGVCQWTSIDKTTVFELRTNTSTKSTGTIVNTSLITTSSIRAGATISQDLYKNGALHTTTVKSTGIEHWWIRIYSKSATSGSFLYKISYTTE